MSDRKDNILNFAILVLSRTFAILRISSWVTRLSSLTTSAAWSGLPWSTRGSWWSLWSGTAVSVTGYAWRAGWALWSPKNISDFFLINKVNSLWTYGSPTAPGGPRPWRTSFCASFPGGPLMPLLPSGAPHPGKPGAPCAPGGPGFPGCPRAPEGPSLPGGPALNPGGPGGPFCPTQCPQAWL